MPDQCKFYCRVLCCQLIFCNNNNTWHVVWGLLPKQPWLCYSLSFKIPQKLDACALERIGSGWKLGFRLIQDVVPTSLWWKRVALRLRVASGSAGGELWEQRGAETGLGSLGPQWTLLRPQHWRLESSFDLHQRYCMGDRHPEGGPAFLRWELRKCYRTVFPLILLSSF